MSAYSALILVSSPNGYWRLGEASGTVAVSEVNNATMQGVYQTSPPLGIAGAIAGDPDTAVTFSSISPITDVQALGFTHQTLQDVGDVFSWEAWLKRSVVGAIQNTPFSNGGNPSFCVRFNTNNTLRLDKEGVAIIVSSTVTIADIATFHHCVITKNGATVKIYIDGVDVTGTVTNQTLTNPTGPWFIAADAGGAQHFDGTIDETALYPTALSAATVLAHYRTGSTPTLVTPGVPTVYGFGAC